MPEKTYVEDCGESLVPRGERRARQCNRPSKATSYWKDHTYPMRVCGIHARACERQGFPVKWDQ